jgi:hypothetical protein
VVLLLNTARAFHRDALNHERDGKSQKAQTEKA